MTPKEYFLAAAEEQRATDAEIRQGTHPDAWKRPRKPQRESAGFLAAVALYQELKPNRTSKPKVKTLCKNKPHLWVKVMRKIEIWPYEVERYQKCSRCGRKQKGGIIV